MESLAGALFDGGGERGLKTLVGVRWKSSTFSIISRRSEFHDVP